MKNILLIFLSTVQTNPDNSVRETKYDNLGGEPTHTTNESAVRYILQENIPLDKIFILASKTVRENPAVNNKTSLQYFIERIAKFTDAQTEIFNYDETSADNLKSVAEMAGLIQNFAQDAEVTLHVDLTGGLRHVNMIMLDVIRLLEYSGIKIGRLIYSNYNIHKVEEINSVYDLFQLIVGVEEFVRFGSVKALKDYYRSKNISPELKNLVEAMEIFADEIKLCHYGQLRKSIIRLHDAVHDFSAGEDVQDILMARLIGRIHKDYHSLIELRDLDDLRVIRWCVENDYMQQALTLYTERVPEYLGRKNFFSVNAEKKSEILRELAEMRIDKLNFYFYLLNNYKETSDEFNKISRALLQEIDRLHRPYFRLVKEDSFTAIRKGNFNYDSWRQQVQQLLDETCATVQLEPGEILCEDETLLRTQLELLVALKENPAPLMNLDSIAPFKKFLIYKDGKFRAELEKIPDAPARFKKLLELLKQRDDIAKKYLPNLKPKKYPQTFRLQEMIQGGIFYVTIPEKIFLSIMDKYFRLKIERNHSNHAHAESSEFATAEELKIFIEAGISEIEAFKDNG